MEANPGPFQGIAAYGSFSNKVSIRLVGNEALQTQIRPHCSRRPILFPAIISASSALNLCSAARLCRQTTRLREAERLSC